MSLTSTRTHTHFFGDDDLAGLDREIAALSTDWVDRREHVSPELRTAGDVRVTLLHNAAALLRERAD
jgi:hypothetical protein